MRVILSAVVKSSRSVPLPSSPVTSTSLRSQPVTVTVPALQPLAGVAPVQKNPQLPVRQVLKRTAKQTAKDELHDAFSDADGDAFAKTQTAFPVSQDSQNQNF